VQGAARALCLYRAPSQAGEDGGVELLARRGGTGAVGRIVPIVLQKSAVIAARLLPRSLGTVLTSALCGAVTLDQTALTHDIG
jgi:hypothetical protein